MSSGTYYASDELLAQYCEFHFGAEYLGVSNFPKACIDIIHPYIENARKGRALDLGCAVGRSSFELAKVYEHVDALDFSERFIQAGEALRSKASLGFSIVEEGGIKQDKVVSLEDLGLSDVADRLAFYQGDACNLDNDLKGYDLVTAFNLLCRLPEPEAFLRNLANILNDSGIFAIATPCTWLDEFTPREKWVGARQEGDKAVYTFDALQGILSENFTLLMEPVELPFVIRETKRKYQHSFSQYSIWQKK